MDPYSKIAAYLNKCVDTDTLSHSYIFYGPDESAKKEIILKFANKILNPFEKLRVNAERGRSINADFNFNPDLILISADADEERSINLIRQLKKFLILSPYYGKHKVAIIEAAHKLNIYAQSALLKIFEEAPESAIIILSAKTIDGIPKTIVSRGVKLPFWRQNNTELLEDSKIAKIFEEILSGSAQDQYRIFEKFNGYETIEIFKLWLWYLRTRFLFDPSKKLNNLLKTSQNIYFKLNETNINPKFAYDELILSLRNKEYGYPSEI